MERISVAVFPDRAKAEPICKRLADAGITSEIHKSELMLEKLWFAPKTYSVRVEVPCDQFERAEELLLDWDSHGAMSEAIHCPECKSLRVQYPQFAHKSFIPNAVVGLMATFGGERQFYCEDCHYTWPKEGTKLPKARPHSAPYYFIDGVPQQQPPEPRRKAA